MSESESVFHSYYGEFLQEYLGWPLPATMCCIQRAVVGGVGYLFGSQMDLVETIGSS